MPVLQNSHEVGQGCVYPEKHADHDAQPRPRGGDTIDLDVANYRSQSEPEGPKEEGFCRMRQGSFKGGLGTSEAVYEADTDSDEEGKVENKDNDSYSRKAPELMRSVVK